MEDIVVFIVLIALGWFWGQRAERAHFRSIERREAATAELPVVTFASAFDPQQVAEVRLVSGECAISNDYFKSVIAALRNFFGGQVVAYESLLDRARREAILRMKLAAADADLIAQVRIEGATIGQEKSGRGGVVSVGALAYGTAIWLKQ